eukprot:5390735-Prymnesium_polylepis.1
MTPFEKRGRARSSRRSSPRRERLTLAQLSGNAAYIISEVKGAHSALTRSSSRFHLLWPVCLRVGSAGWRRVDSMLWLGGVAG